VKTAVLLFPAIAFSVDFGHRDNQGERLMRKLSITLATAALALSMTTLVVNAQSQGASTLKAQVQNATIIHKAACGGFGRWCGPGMTRVCGPYRCWCRPC
jgi:hypothetical protein